MAQFLKVKEAAVECGVGVNRMYELVSQGVVPHVRFGPKCIRIPVVALQELAKKIAAREPAQ